MQKVVLKLNKKFFKHCLPSYFCEINFCDNIVGCMETPRLFLTPIKHKDIKEYYGALFSQAEVMEKYAEGRPRDFRTVNTLLSGYVQAWQEGNPYSYFSVFTKEPKQFIGTVFVTTRNQLKGIGLLGYIFLQDIWRRGYATEALIPLLFGYIPLINKKKKDLWRIYATVKEDNIASCKLLEKLGFLKQDIVSKFSGKRLEYSIILKKLLTLHKNYKVKL